MNGRVPGCSGTAQGKTDYCVVPTDEMLQYVGNNNRPKTAFPLEKCQGDCDNDDDCAGQLKCYQRSDDELIPGCLGKGKNRKDYCYDAGAPVCTPEGEACVNCFEDNCDSNAIKVKDTNRGCDAEYGGPYFFNTIAIGETICGTSSAFDEYSDGVPDIDWYQFTLYTEGIVSATLKTNFEAYFVMRDNADDCELYGYVNQGDSTVADGLGNYQYTISENLSPGVYALQVLPSVYYEGLRCGVEDGSYTLTLDA